MIDEKILMQHDSYIVDKESRKLKGLLTDAEKQEARELEIAKEELAKIFGGKICIDYNLEIKTITHNCLC